MLPKIDVKRIAIFLVIVFALFLQGAVLKLAFNSNQHLQEANKLKIALVEKDIELKAIKEELRVEIYMAKVSEETIAKLQASEKDTNAKLAEQKAISDKKAPVLNKRIQTAKVKVAETAAQIHPESIELTLDTIINEAGIKDSAEVDEYIQAQMEESKAVIEELNYVHCLIVETEQKNLGKETTPCVLPSF